MTDQYVPWKRLAARIVSAAMAVQRHMGISGDLSSNHFQLTWDDGLLKHCALFQNVWVDGDSNLMYHTNPLRHETFTTQLNLFRLVHSSKEMPFHADQCAHHWTPV